MRLLAALLLTACNVYEAPCLLEQEHSAADVTVCFDVVEEVECSCDGGSK